MALYQRFSVFDFFTFFLRNETEERSKISGEDKEKGRNERYNQWNVVSCMLLMLKN